MEIERYKDLPDGLSADELRPYFEELLSEAEQSSVSSVEVVRAFYELADRQWHTYERLDSALRVRIESCLQRHWVVMSEFINPVAFVIGSLGLSGALPLVSASLAETTDPVVLSAIQNILRDQYIDDPHSGIPRQHNDA